MGKDFAATAAGEGGVGPPLGGKHRSPTGEVQGGIGPPLGGRFLRRSEAEAEVGGLFKNSGHRPRLSFGCALPLGELSGGAGLRGQLTATLTSLIPFPGAPSAFAYRHRPSVGQPPPPLRERGHVERKCVAQRRDRTPFRGTVRGAVKVSGSNQGDGHSASPRPVPGSSPRRWPYLHPLPVWPWLLRGRLLRTPWQGTAGRRRYRRCERQPT